MPEKPYQLPPQSYIRTQEVLYRPPHTSPLLPYKSTTITLVSDAPQGWPPSQPPRPLTHGCLRRLVELHCCTTARVGMCFTMPAMNTNASDRRSRRHDDTAAMNRQRKDGERNYFT